MISAEKKKEQESQEKRVAMRLSSCGAPVRGAATLPPTHAHNAQKAVAPAFAPPFLPPLYRCPHPDERKIRCPSRSSVALPYNAYTYIYICICMYVCVCLCDCCSRSLFPALLKNRARHIRTHAGSGQAKREAVSRGHQSCRAERMHQAQRMRSCGRSSMPGERWREGERRHHEPPFVSHEGPSSAGLNGRVRIACESDARIHSRPRRAYGRQYASQDVLRRDPASQPVPFSPSSFGSVDAAASSRDPSQHSVTGTLHKPPPPVALVLSRVPGRGGRDGGRK